MMSRDSGKRREASARDLEATGGRDARMEIVPYDLDWPRRFLAEAERLQRLVPELALHHIGSTAVPGLAAKPVIDMMALVDDLDALREPIIDAGYQYPQASNAALRGRRWFCWPSVAVRTHHLHLVVDRAELDRYLHFRDLLWQRPDLAEEYAALKRYLAQQSSEDRESYTAGKSTFIERVQALTLRSISRCRTEPVSCSLTVVLSHWRTRAVRVRRGSATGLVRFAIVVVAATIEEHT